MDDDLLNISGDYLEIFKDASSDMASWMEDLLKAMNCKSHYEASKEKFMKQSKETLVKCLLAGYQTAYSHTESFETARVEVENMKSELIGSQRTVVKLQQQLLDAQSEQLKSVTTVVDSAVEKGIQSYSQAVSQSLPKSAPSLTEEKLKKVVQEAVADEDRSKNVMVFGIKEEKGEELNSKIAAMFEEISEKPSFEAVRVGKESVDRIRPVKVSLRSSGTVHQILVKAKQLKPSTTHRSVFIGPDRSPEERVKHRELIATMKLKAKEDSTKHYYVRNGCILSRDKD